MSSGTPTWQAAGTLPRARLDSALLSRGVVLGYLSVIVLLPLAGVAWTAVDEGGASFWRAISNPQAQAALKLSFFASLVVVAINAVTGTLIAWVLVRDDFRGKSVINALIDLPFALPTIVAGLTLLALYGPKGPLGVNVAYTRTGVVLALLFVTLPFVVRSVQPVLLELDPEMEDAAAALGAGSWTTFRRIVLPALAPAVLSGSSLAFARALGEFGAVVLISGNVPFETQLASVQIYGQIESDNEAGAAAVSVVLLLLSLAILTLLTLLQRRWLRHAH